MSVNDEIWFNFSTCTIPSYLHGDFLSESVSLYGCLISVCTGWRCSNVGESILLWE